MARQAETLPTTRDRILNTAMAVIREKGYAATTVDDLCAGAGVTKGAFFHHFKSKEDLAVRAAEYWSTVTGELFRQAPYHRPADPLDRVFGYLDFRKALLEGKVPEFTCLVGTLVQETYDSSPVIRDACRDSIWGHAAEVAKDIEAARALHVPDAPWSAESLALHTQVVLQGAFILAKAQGNAAIAAESIDHLRRYFEFLFQTPAAASAQGVRHEPNH